MEEEEGGERGRDGGTEEGRQREDNTAPCWPAALLNEALMSSLRFFFFGDFKTVKTHQNPEMKPKKPVRVICKKHETKKTTKSPEKERKN